MNKKHKTTLAKTETINRQLIDYEKTLFTINEYLLRKRELKSQHDILSAQLFNKEEVLELINHLKADAQNLKLNVKEITPSVSELLMLNALPPGDGAPRYLDIAMRYTGSYKGAGIFLKELEKERMFVSLLSFDVSSRETGLVPAEYRIRFSSMIGGSSESPASE
jgi:Tfp pilus assembly protein PilO